MYHALFHYFVIQSDGISEESQSYVNVEGLSIQNLRFYNQQVSTLKCQNFCITQFRNLNACKLFLLHNLDTTKLNENLSISTSNNNKFYKNSDFSKNLNHNRKTTNTLPYNYLKDKQKHEWSNVFYFADLNTILVDSIEHCKWFDFVVWSYVYRDVYFVAHHFVKQSDLVSSNVGSVITLPKSHLMYLQTLSPLIQCLHLTP